MVVSRWAQTGNQIVATTPHMAGERWKGKVIPACDPTTGTPRGREGSAGQGTEGKPFPPPLQSHDGTQEHQHQALVQEVSEQEAVWEPRGERDQGRTAISLRRQQTKRKNNCCLTDPDLFITRGMDLFPGNIVKEEG